jgi:predicted transcriptional regulator
LRRRESLVLDKEEEKVVDLFFELGMPKNQSKTLMYISQFDECKSADVERGADLRQPEVSVAINKLRKKGWVKRRVQKKENERGRPIHFYSSAKPLTDIIKSFEQEKLTEIETVKSDISELKNLLENK